MSATKIALIGAGKLDRVIPVVASLATYFGERPLDITFYHSEEEMLDLVDRFARLCFVMNQSTHSLRSTTFLEEALEDADALVMLAPKSGITIDSRVLDLRTGWPSGNDQADEFVVALQILRWLNGEEYPYQIFRELDDSPIKAWLDRRVEALGR